MSVMVRSRPTTTPVTADRRPDGFRPARTRTNTDRVGLVLRLALLFLCTLLIAATAREVRALLWVGLLTVVALVGWLMPGVPLLPTVARGAEVVVTAIGAGMLAWQYSGGDPSALLPYLLAPILLSAIAGRLLESMALLGVAASLLVLVGGLTSVLGHVSYLLSAAEWLAMAGLSAVFVHAVQQLLATGQPEPQPYAEATRLLTQLRTVARQLPGATLDPRGIAEHVIEEIRAIAPADRAAVLSASGGGRLVVLAQHGVDRVDWETSLDADSAIAEAWASQQTQVSSRSQARTAPGGDVSTLIMPLLAGVRTIALIALEADRAGAYPSSLVHRVNALAAPAALRLEAALLFDDVRSLATNEERQRLAREIHDGVAQELVMVGYGIDNALATLPEEAVVPAEELRDLRAEVTRVITELRLSLFELRSEVDSHGGLAGAIAEYARTVASSAGLRVHYSLEESTARLPAATEAELLRIAQEAITNARKHSGAQNLWITCEIDPPYARIEVADDGTGMRGRPEGRYGLAIMTERAERIRGQLEITPREAGGTSVAVVVGAPPRREVTDAGLHDLTGRYGRR
jgi:signal transduction histidine kinase